RIKRGQKHCLQTGCSVYFTCGGNTIMVRMSLGEARQRSLGEAAEQVCASKEALAVMGPDGEMVRLVPVPKPVRQCKGRPVYRLDDVQHFEFPYWDNPGQSKE